MRNALAIIGVAATLSGSALWGQTESPRPSATAEYDKAYAEAFEKSFRVAFRANSIEQCVASAPMAKAARYDITPTCSCLADTLLATKTVEELTVLSREGPSTALQAVTAQCLQTNPPTVSSKR